MKRRRYGDSYLNSMNWEIAFWILLINDFSFLKENGLSDWFEYIHSCIVIILIVKTVYYCKTDSVSCWIHIVSLRMNSVETFSSCRCLITPTPWICKGQVARDRIMIVLSQQLGCINEHCNYFWMLVIYKTHVVDEKNSITPLSTFPKCTIL